MLLYEQLLEASVISQKACTTNSYLTLTVVFLVVVEVKVSSFIIIINEMIKLMTKCEMSNNKQLITFFNNNQRNCTMNDSQRSPNSTKDLVLITNTLQYNWTMQQSVKCKDLCTRVIEETFVS